MATTTTNLSLTKPGLSDSADIAVIDTDLDAIDALWDATPPSALDPTATSSAGATTNVARADHAHGGPGFAAPVAVGTANATGVATTLVRSDHVHKAPLSILNHVEVFDVEAAVAEVVDVYVPSAFEWARLTLRGRAPRAGLLASHDHAGSTAVSATHAHTTTVGAESALHIHGGTTQTESVNHTHGFTTGTESALHTHTVTVGNEVEDHTHSITSDGTHHHALHVNALSNSLQTSSTTFTNQTDLSVDAGAHTHGGATGLKSAKHTHAGTSATESAAHAHGGTTNTESALHTHTYNTGTENATHDHVVTVAGGDHGHTLTVTAQGVGGAVAASRPSSVSVTINGVDRTVALGGAFGASGADWANVDLDVTTYLTAEAWNTISVQSATVGRLKVHVMAKLV